MLITCIRCHTCTCIILHNHRRSRFAAGPVHQFTPYTVQQQPSSSGLDDFEEGDQASTQTPLDFAQKIRTTVMLDFQDCARGEQGDKQLIGLEVLLMHTHTRILIILVAMISTRLMHCRPKLASDNNYCDI